ncbi:hypothetical protein Q5752_004746 [Cryptotrichosporon argae]
MGMHEIRSSTPSLGSAAMDQRAHNNIHPRLSPQSRSMHSHVPHDPRHSTDIGQDVYSQQRRLPAPQPLIKQKPGGVVSKHPYQRHIDAKMAYRHQEQATQSPYHAFTDTYEDRDNVDHDRKNWRAIRRLSQQPLQDYQQPPAPLLKVQASSESVVEQELSENASIRPHVDVGKLNDIDEDDWGSGQPLAKREHGSVFDDADNGVNRKPKTANPFTLIERMSDMPKDLVTTDWNKLWRKVLKEAESSRTETTLNFADIGSLHTAMSGVLENFKAELAHTLDAFSALEDLKKDVLEENMATTQKFIQANSENRDQLNKMHAYGAWGASPHER